MRVTESFFCLMRSTFKDFASDFNDKLKYEIMDLYECEKIGFQMAEIKLYGRHIKQKSVASIVSDADFLANFDTKAVRALTYIATIEQMKPDYSIVSQYLESEVDDYILEIRSRNGKSISKGSPSEISKSKVELSKFSQVDANRIGYLAGVKETVKEFNLKKPTNVMSE
jgi:hypothetical protein